MDVDFDIDPITENEVIYTLGSNYKIQGQEIIWKCPACPGGDKSGDNLKFNKQKHVLKCFACDFAEEVTGIIARRRFEAQKGTGQEAQPQEYAFKPREQFQQDPEPAKEKEIPQESLAEYYYECNLYLMGRKDLLKKMYNKHRIMPHTACSCFIGYDNKKKMLVFPSRAIGKDPTNNQSAIDNGAEYREIDGEKTIRRISGYDPAICLVHGGAFVMHGIICEGYKDAYNLVQILRMTNPELLNCTAIFTVQNGTNSINTNNCLQKVNWNRFETIGLIMDNDKAGDKATEIALELFPKMKDLRSEYIAGYADIEKRFSNEFGVHVDIDRALSAAWLNEYEEICV